MIKIDQAWLRGGPYDNIHIDTSVSLCEALLMEKEGWHYIRQGHLEDFGGLGPAAIFQWEEIHDPDNPR